MRKLLSCLGMLLLLNASFSQTTNISGVVNQYFVVDSIYNVNCFPFIQLATTTGLSVGDKVLIIQMQGAVMDSSNTSSFGSVIDIANCGNYEYATIHNISGTTIELLSPLLRSYDVKGAVQLVKVPQYVNANVTATLSCTPWNGSTGGVLAIDCSGTLSLAAGIDVSGKGFRGGIIYPDSGFYCGDARLFWTKNRGLIGPKGEGIVKFRTNYEAGRGSYTLGGGSGMNHNSGGGGGGNAGAGGRGGNQYTDCGIATNYGLGGKNLTYSVATGKIFMGGGGGSGEQNNSVGTNGGNGGGIIIIRANQITGGTQTILANGQSQTTSALNDGAGGAGGGGCVLLKVNSYSGSLGVSALGGIGGGNNDNNYYGCAGPGGGGGGGCIWYSTATLPITVLRSVLGGAAGISLNTDNPCGSTSCGGASGANGSELNGLSIIENTYVPPRITAKSNDTIVCPLNEVINYISYFGSNSISVTWMPMTGVTLLTDSLASIKVSDTSLFTVVASDGTCADTAKIWVYTYPDVIANAGADQNICLGDSIQLNATGGGSYAWSPSTNITNTNIANPYVYPGDTQSYYLLVTSIENCTDRDTININVLPLPNANAGADDTLCAGQSIALNATGGISYTWSPATSLSNANIANPIASPLTTTLYTLTVSNLYSCTASDQLLLWVAPNPSLSVNPTDTSICPTENFSFAASGADFYQWTPNTYLSADNISNPNCTPLSDIIYQIVGTSNMGCSDTAFANISVLDSFNIEVSADTSICLGDTALLIASVNPSTGNYTYQWSPASSLTYSDSSITFSYPSGTTTYTVIVTSNSGCSQSSNTRVTINPLPESGLNNEYIIAPNENLDLAIPVYDSILWTSDFGFEAINESAVSIRDLKENGIMMLYMSDENSCINEDTIYIIVQRCGNLPIPNVFTPNDDGVNDRYRLDNIGIDTLRIFTVYNRWGEVVFQSFDENDAWDGTFNGKQLDMDVFTYMLEGICDGKAVVYTGNITLIR